MKKRTRADNFMLNTVIGIMAQTLTLLMLFINRKLFIRFFSIEYLGINGLFSNILSILSLTELGLGTVATFSLFQPVANKDKTLICALVHYYKKLYIIVAALVGIIGIAVVPFLKYIVNSEMEKEQLVIYYLLFLLNTIVSYFAAHKVALLAANQESRTQKIVELFTVFIQQVVHIAIFLIYPNYILYVLSTIAVTLVGRIILNTVADKRYRYCLRNNQPEFTLDTKLIKDNLKSSAIYKLSNVLVNNTDNIIISILVSTAAVGLYSNYCTITSALQGFIMIITVAINNVAGNLFASKEKEQLLRVFNTTVLFYHFISCYCAVALYFLFNDFISIWLGEKYVLDNLTVFSIVLNFYLTNLITPIWSFREATGQFEKTKYILLATAAINIILSVILGYFYGMFGILIATAASKILTQVWYEPRILFRNVFFISQHRYWASQAKNICSTALCVAMCTFINNALSHGIIEIVIKGFAFFIVCLMIFWGMNLKAEEIQIIKQFIKRGNNYV